jgi:hypothetical protein
MSFFVRVFTGVIGETARSNIEGEIAIEESGRLIAD